MLRRFQCKSRLFPPPCRVLSLIIRSALSGASGGSRATAEPDAAGLSHSEWPPPTHGCPKASEAVWGHGQMRWDKRSETCDRLQCTHLREKATTVGPPRGGQAEVREGVSDREAPAPWDTLRPCDAVTGQQRNTKKIRTKGAGFYKTKYMPFTGHPLVICCEIKKFHGESFLSKKTIRTVWALALEVLTWQSERSETLSQPFPLKRGRVSCSGATNPSEGCPGLSPFTSDARGARGP